MMPSMPFGRSRGVSPVIGVVLLVAIVVILASTVGVFVLGLAEENQTVVPTVIVSSEYEDGGSSDVLLLAVESGDVVPTSELDLQLEGATDGSGPVTFDADLSDQVDTELEAGESVTIDQSSTDASSNLDLSDATVRLVWEDDGSSDILWTWTAE